MGFRPENDWRRLFVVEGIQPEFQIKTAPGDCDSNCLNAKELKCTCKCGGRNHGAALRSHIKPLTQFENTPITARNPIICHFCHNPIATSNVADSILYDAHTDCLEMWRTMGSYAEIY